MNTKNTDVILKIGFHLIRQDDLEVVDFNTSDFESEEEWLGAIESHAEKLSAANEGRGIYYNYYDVSQTPRGKFYPTGGVKWAEKAWQYAQWLNTPPPADTALMRGDKVRFLNAYGHPLECTIFGFTQDGEAILDWDCYWVSKPCGHLTKVDVL